MTLKSQLDQMGEIRVGRIGRRVRVQAVVLSSQQGVLLGEEIAAFNGDKASLVKLSGMRRFIRSCRLRFRGWWHNIEAKRCQLFYAQLFALFQKNGELTKNNSAAYQCFFDNGQCPSHQNEFLECYKEIKCLMYLSRSSSTNFDKKENLFNPVELRKWLHAIWWTFLVEEAYPLDVTPKKFPTLTTLMTAGDEVRNTFLEKINNEIGEENKKEITDMARVMMLE